MPYCMNDTVLGVKGCLYDNVGHAYLPQNEKASLGLDFEKFDKEVINSVRE